MGFDKAQMAAMNAEKTSPEHTQMDGDDRYIIVGQHGFDAAFEFLHNAVAGNGAFREHTYHAAPVQNLMHPVKKLLHLLGLSGFGYFQSADPAEKPAEALQAVKVAVHQNGDFAPFEPHNKEGIKERNVVGNDQRRAVIRQAVGIFQPQAVKSIAQYESERAHQQFRPPHQQQQAPAEHDTQRPDFQTIGVIDYIFPEIFESGHQYHRQQYNAEHLQPMSFAAALVDVNKVHRHPAADQAEVNPHHQTGHPPNKVSAGHQMQSQPQTKNHRQGQTGQQAESPAAGSGYQTRHSRSSNRYHTALTVQSLRQSAMQYDKKRRHTNDK